MNIQLFNFLEDYSSQIVELVRERITGTGQAYQDMSESTVKELVEHVLDGYIDLLVTGQTDALDRVFNPLSRVLAVRGTAFSDVFGLPLAVAAVVRGLLADEYTELEGDEGIRKFNTALELTDGTAHRAACRFLDVFQEHLTKRVDEHNRLLADIQRDLGVDLRSFTIAPVES